MADMCMAGIGAVISRIVGVGVEFDVVRICAPCGVGMTRVIIGLAALAVGVGACAVVASLNRPILGDVGRDGT